MFYVGIYIYLKKKLMCSNVENAAMTTQWLRKYGAYGPLNHNSVYNTAIYS